MFGRYLDRNDRSRRKGATNTWCPPHAESLLGIPSRVILREKRMNEESEEGRSLKVEVELRNFETDIFTDQRLPDPK